MTPPIGKITIEGIDQLALLVGELTRLGIRFEARKDDVTKLWIVTITGGY